MGGHLGGHDDDGPLSAGLGVTVGAPATPGDQIVFGGGVVFSDDASGPVVIESADVNRSTPGLRTKIAYYAGSKHIGSARGPLPPGSTPIAGGRLMPGPVGSTRGGILVGASAPRPGIYHFDGIRLRYRRGHRRFEHIVGFKTVLCVNRQRKCPADTL